ncbi:threonine/serine dehydratase [Hoeflea sp.]|uniref:threonine ammonia-lyase n=1 Tax=Hoeflea sp. TaxID=1940281 RepID=UPI0025BEF715|nr:threonine/serine dehydratase [Hoeflea sp.]
MSEHITRLIPEDNHPDHRLKLDNIRRAMDLIDPVFLNSPQYDCEPLSEAVGCQLQIKVETANPIRSFKGRGATFLIHERRMRGEIEGRSLVGASAGNWGQALAYACRSHRLALVLYASTAANPLKVERMRGFGAEVRLEGDDFDAAKQAAEAFAAESGGMMLADGLDPEASEGACTMALELMSARTPPDCIVVPLGNGAMLTGIARWAKAANPGIQIIGVQATGADAMEKSWRTGTLAFPPAVSTIADGIGVRVPIAEAVADLQGLVDDVHLVEDAALIEAMRLFHGKAGLVAEPSGAAGLAAILSRPEVFRGRRVATILCGGNLTGEQMRTWLG